MMMMILPMHADDEDEAAEFLMDLKNKDEGQRFFWQYNVLSKGPKGRRLCQSIENPDPHVLGDFQDPVFHQEQDKYKHNGKARRGDGNDITPNPYKLFATGIELQKLNKQINSMAPGNDWPSSQKNKTLKERNKLASRACRLKKKAQHEANKLKLHGLKLEHSEELFFQFVMLFYLTRSARMPGKFIVVVIINCFELFSGPQLWIWHNLMNSWHLALSCWLIFMCSIVHALLVLLNKYFICTTCFAGQVMKVISLVKELLTKKTKKEISPDVSMLQQFHVFLKKHHSGFFYIFKFGYLSVNISLFKNTSRRSIF